MTMVRLLISDGSWLVFLTAEKATFAPPERTDIPRDVPVTSNVGLESHTTRHFPSSMMGSVSFWAAAKAASHSAPRRTAIMPVLFVFWQIFSPRLTNSRVQPSEGSPPVSPSPSEGVSRWERNKSTEKPKSSWMHCLGSAYCALNHWCDRWRRRFSVSAPLNWIDTPPGPNCESAVGNPPFSSTSTHRLVCYRGMAGARGPVLCHTSKGVVDLDAFWPPQSLKFSIIASFFAKLNVLDQFRRFT